VWFEGQHINELPMRLDRQHELYIFFRFCFINVDIVYIHGTFYMSVIIVLVRSGGVYKYDSFMSVLIISL